MQTAQSPAKDVVAQRWWSVALLAAVAIGGGVLLPQWFPARSTPAQTTAAAPAKNDYSYTPPAWPEAPSHDGMLWRLGLGTLFVLGLCVVTLLLGKRWLRVMPTTPAGNVQLRHLESLQLGNRCVVHLIQVANRPVLVGSDPSGIKTVVPLPASFAETLMAAEDHAPPV